MYLIQIVLLLFCLFAVSKVITRYRADDISVGWLIFWLVFWFLAALVSYRPDTTAFFARLFGVGRGADVVMYFSLALLFFLFFKLLVKIEQLEKHITKVVRGNALNQGLEKFDIKK